MKKIVLIEAGEPRTINIFRKAKLPRLGLLLLGKILKNLGKEVKIYYEDIAPINWSDVLSADLVGISSLTSTATRAYEIVQKIKIARHNIPVVKGGPHVTFLPEEALQQGADFVVRGEGEKTTVELVQWLEDRSEKSIEEILGLSYRIGNKIFHNPPRPLLSSEELDLLPFPDLSLIERFKMSPTIPVLTSRGCPFNCKFCSVTKMFGGEYKFRSVENVIEELKELKIQFPRFGKSSSDLFFYDDNFAAKPERTKRLLRAMIDEGLLISWSAQTRVDVSKDLELLELMKKSGCEWLYLGLESVNPQTLKDFQKRQSVEDIEKGVPIIRGFGIRTLGQFIIGGESDDPFTAQNTVQFAKRLKLDAAQLWILTPIPGTPIFQELDEQNRILYKGPEHWWRYNMEQVVINPKGMSSRELQLSVLFKALPQFYSTWRWVKKGLKMMGNFFSFTSWKSKRISLENFVLYLYARRLLKRGKNSLKSHLKELEEKVKSEN